MGTEVEVPKVIVLPFGNLHSHSQNPKNRSGNVLSEVTNSVTMPGRKYVRTGISGKESFKKRMEASKSRQARGRAAAQSIVRRGNRRGQSGSAVSGSAVKQSPNSTLFPNGLKCPLVYCETIQFAVGSGTAPVSQAFRANSLFDPNHTGVGHQPRYFDTLCGASGSAAPYGRYKVNACKAEITAMNSGSSHMGVFVSFQGAGVSHPATWAEARERTNAVTKLLAPADAAGSVAKIDLYRTIASLYPNAPSDQDLLGSDTANPTREAFVYVDVFNIYGAGTVTVHADCKLTYYSEFSEKNDVLDS